MPTESKVENPLVHPVLFTYQVGQYLTSKILSPNPPDPDRPLGRPNVAIIGAGITGVSAAAHCVGHGFDCTIFEAGPEEELGGIWSVSTSKSGVNRMNTQKFGANRSACLQRVNNTSSLQIHSIMYRFFPSVQWTSGYPDRQQILSQLRQLWKQYGLQSKTKFNVKINKVYQDDKGRWILNDPSNGSFDGLIAAVGTCGEPKREKCSKHTWLNKMLTFLLRASHPGHGQIPRSCLSFQ